MFRLGDKLSCSPLSPTNPLRHTPGHSCPDRRARPHRHPESPGAGGGARFGDGRGGGGVRGHRGGGAAAGGGGGGRGNSTATSEPCLAARTDDWHPTHTPTHQRHPSIRQLAALLEGLTRDLQGAASRNPEGYRRLREEAAQLVAALGSDERRRRDLELYPARLAQQRQQCQIHQPDCCAAKEQDSAGVELGPQAAEREASVSGAQQLGG
jgi:hypothetical protein